RFEKYFTGTHSDLLRPFAEMGVPAALVLLTALALAVRRFPRGMLGAKAALLCLGIHALFENLSERPADYLLAAALLGSLLSAAADGATMRTIHRAALAAGLVFFFVVADVLPYLAWLTLRGLPRPDPGLDHRLAMAWRSNPLHPDIDLR